MTRPTLTCALLLAMTGASGAQSCIGVVNGTLRSDLPCPNPPQWAPPPDLAEWCKLHDSFRDDGTGKHISVCNGVE